jgi:type II restriction enzyme
MTYYERINELIKSVPKTLVDFELPRNPARSPTQASSNFITNKEQGDWAENLILSAINETSKNFRAVKYGKSDDIVAGEEGFETFYKGFQDELDTIGKRPDLLIFEKEDYNSDLGEDISKLPH